TGTRVAGLHRGTYTHEGFDVVMACWITGATALIRQFDQAPDLLHLLASALPGGVSMEVRQGPVPDAQLMVMDRHAESSPARGGYFGQRGVLSWPPSRTLLLSGGLLTDHTANMLLQRIHAFHGQAPESAGMVIVPSETELKQWLSYRDNDNQALNRTHWMNNYDYRKSIRLINGLPFLDNGWACFVKGEGMAPLGGTVHYQLKSQPRMWQIMKDLNLENVHEVIACHEEDGLPPTVRRVFPSLHPWALRILKLRDLILSTAAG
ncbi:MAG TPA: hypothetical protein P5248_04560, partial [Bacteroidales bacterium]|nr:hypothetical protein [Bacteroidales bacterium]